MEAPKRNPSQIVIDAREGFFHAMLSYRVNSDAELVSKIHDKLHLLAPNTGQSVSQANQLLNSPFPEGFKRVRRPLRRAWLDLRNEASAA